MGKLRIADDLALPLDWMTMATVVYGARGAGKTTLGAVVAEEVTKAKQRFCAIDLKGDWYGVKSSANGREAGIPAVIFGGDHADLPLKEDEGATVGAMIAELQQSSILDLEYFSKGKQVRFLAEFFSTLYDKNRDPLLLLLDEAQRYAPQRPISPESALCLGAVEDLVKLGRKHGIGPMLFTQRGSGLNKEVSEICDMLVAFRTPGPLDQDRVKDWLEANVTREERDRVMGLLAGLDTGTAVFASGHPALKLFKVANVRTRETFDSSATPKVGHRRAEPKQLAKPDLEALKQKMAATIERAKLDDPKELRRRIAELERERPKLLQDAAKASKLVELPVPVVKPADLKRAEMLVSRLEAAIKRISSDTEDLGAQAAALIRAISSVKRAGNDLSQAAEGSPPPGAARFPGSSNDLRFNNRSKTPGNSLLTGPNPARNPAETRPGAEQRVLDALAELEDLGVQRPQRNQVALLAGYTNLNSKGLVNAMGALRSAGLIDYPESGRVTLTEPGRAQAASWGVPRTAKEIQDRIVSLLGGASARILKPLIQSYPKPVERAAVASAAGYENLNSKGFVNAIGRLRSLGFIDYPSSGLVAACPVLFLENGL